MSIRNQERQRARILELAAELWKEQGELDLDQIDGTFYFNLCKADEIQRIRDEGKDAGKHPMSTHERLRELIPNWQWPEYDRKRPRMRDAADLSRINVGGRLTADGSMIERDDVPLAGLSWIRLGIRNREWTGTHVEKEFRAHKVVGGFGTTPMPNPPYPENETVAFIGAKLYRDGEFGYRFYWNPEQEYPDAPPGFWNEEGQWGVSVDTTDPNWEVIPWGPMVLVSVPEPLPPVGVIAAFYDSAVIEQRKWHAELLGANNGQDVLTAIRTWLVALLMVTGTPYRDAIGSAEDIGLRWVHQPKYSLDKKSLLARVPEAAPFIDRRPR